MCDEVLAVAGKEVYDGDLNHGVCSGSETHRGAGHAYKELGSERRIID